MTDDAPQVIETVPEPTDAEVKAFFESDGEKAPAAAPPPPEPKAEPIAEKPPEKPKEAPPEKYVPLNALHEERTRRKEMAAELAKLRQELDALKAPRPVEPPPLDQDPAGHLLHKIAATEAELAAVKQETAAQRQAREIEIAKARFTDAYRQAAQQFAEQTPDFAEAYGHWTKQRITELAEAGYPRDQAMAILEAEEAAIVQNAWQQDANPAERVYKLAKLKGYAGKAAAATGASDAEKLAAVEKGQQTKGLAAGGKGTSPNSPEALLEMDDEEFAKNFNRIIRKAG